MTLILKAAEFDKQSSKFRKRAGSVDALYETGLYMLQPKYDGCFGAAVIDPLGSRMYSRTGENYTASCEHILRELEEALTTSGMDRAVFLGEVWHPDIAFPTISGKFRRQAPSPDLKFAVFDMLESTGMDTLSDSRMYLTRYHVLQTILPEIEGASPATFVAEVYRGDLSATAAAAAWKAEGGYDGAILRDTGAAYTPGVSRNGEIIKVKPTLSLDLRCIDARTEPGERTGRPVLTLTVSINGKPCDVGSGVPHDLTVGDVSGKIVEVEFMGYTPDGLLREPRFKGVRHDKESPDA